jgi:hypothetical protein
MSDDLDTVVIWEAPKIIPPEFRLYYDKNGKVVCYSCEKLEGDFIVIDAFAFAVARPDVRVIDGKISTVKASSVVFKLMPSLDSDGEICIAEDVSIVVNDEYSGMKQQWKLVMYELK